MSWPLDPLCHVCRPSQVAKLPFVINDGKWHHICISWTTRDGVWEAYQDGTQGGSGENLAPYHPIKPQGVLVLGQEQVPPGEGVLAAAGGAPEAEKGDGGGGKEGGSWRGEWLPHPQGDPRETGYAAPGRDPLGGLIPKGTWGSRGLQAARGGGGNSVFGEGKSALRDARCTSWGRSVSTLGAGGKAGGGSQLPGLLFPVGLGKECRLSEGKESNGGSRGCARPRPTPLAGRGEGRVQVPQTSSAPRAGVASSVPFPVQPVGGGF